jgi:hypothetical protein
MRNPWPRTARGDELLPLEGHEHAALGTDRADREVEDQLEQLVQGPMAGELAAGAHERRHPRMLEREPATLLELHRRLRGPRKGVLAREHAAQARHHRRAQRGVLGRHELHRPARAFQCSEHEHDLPRADAVAAGQARLSLHAPPVDRGAVLRAQVLHEPRVVLTRELEVVPREAHVGREGEVVVRRAAEPETIALERHLAHAAPGLHDRQLHRQRFSLERLARIHPCPRSACSGASLPAPP